MPEAGAADAGAVDGFLGVNPEETLFVGDMESDRQAAENAGCDFVWARDFFDPE